MKTYSVYFSEPVEHKFRDQVWNQETRRWEEGEVTVVKDSFTFYFLKNAKNLIKAHPDKYKGSCITKIWANGDWENLGEIKMKGSNKTFVANTRQKVASY